jgi:hyaluronan synthase
MYKIKFWGGTNENYSGFWLRDLVWHPRRRSHAGNILQKNLPSRQVIRGALAPSYHIPSVTFHPDLGIALSLVTALIVFVVLWKLSDGISPAIKLTFIFSALPLLLRSASWLLSCFDRPYRAKNTDLSELRVVVSVPAFNEAPENVDACLFSLVNQTLLPNVVEFVDDGSNKVDYSYLRNYWTSLNIQTKITWKRKIHEGKRRAHAATFREHVIDTAAYNNADRIIFVTVDSDTILAQNAIEEGIQRFANPEVMSVAGTELGYNYSRNWLTVIQCCLQEYAQVVISGAWSVTGNMFTNRGPFALIRASAFDKILDVYSNEIILGRRVELADDSLTALAGSMSGKSVQQISAVGFTMWPEKIGHHSRQRIRWARGRTVRNFWRLKYYPLTSYIWWFTAVSIYSTLFGIALLLIIIGSWPQSAHELWRLIIAATLIGWVSQLRTLALNRSDETLKMKILKIAVRPVASLWSAIMITRVFRVYGMATFLKQGWTTRQNGAEKTMRPKEAVN